METVETADQEESCEEHGENATVIPLRKTHRRSPAWDGGWEWLVVAGSFLSHVLVGGFERSSGVLYLQLLDRFGHSATLTSWVLSLCTTIMFATGPVMSGLSDRLTCRVVAAVGAGLSVTGVLLSGFTTSLPALYLTYSLLAGIGRGFVYGPSLIIVGYYFDKRRMGLAVGLTTAGTGVGSFLLPPVVQTIFIEYGFTGAWLILAAVLGNMFVCAALYRPLTVGNGARSTFCCKKSQTTSRHNRLTTSDSGTCHTTAKHNASEERMHASPDDGTAINEKPAANKPFLQLYLLKNYAFTTACVQIFFHTVAQHATIVFLPALARGRGIGPIQAAVLLSALGACDAAAKVVISPILDMKNVKRYRLVIYNAIVFLIGAVCITFPQVSDFWQFVVVSGFYGALAGTYVSQKSVVIVDILGTDKLSGTLGLLLLFQGVGSLVGPTVGAMFKDYFGGYEMSFYLGAVGLFIGGVVMATGNVWLHFQKKR